MTREDHQSTSQIYVLVFLQDVSMACYAEPCISYGRVPSLQLGTGKTAAVRVTGRLVGKSCRVSRICPPSVGAAPPRYQ